MGLAVHSKNNLDGVVRKVFGDSVIRVLDRDNKLELKGITTQLLTEKIQIRRLEGPVLAIFVNPEKLDKIVSCDRSSRAMASLTSFLCPGLPRNWWLTSRLIRCLWRSFSLRRDSFPAGGVCRNFRVYTRQKWVHRRAVNP